MRVLHINSGHLYGGIEVLLVTLARLRHLCPEMKSEFALCFPGRTQEELTGAGVVVHLLGGVRISRPWTVWRSRRRLRDLLQQGRYDVVICHGSWSLAIFASAVRKSGVPLVMWLHDAPPAPSLHWLDRLARWNPPDWTIVNSDHTLKWLSRLFPGDNNTRIYPPVECSDRLISPDLRRDTRAKYGADEQSVVLLQVGRWDPYKGHLLLMEALGRLASLPGWICWQAGGISNPKEELYFRAVQDAARRHGIEDRVRYLGFLSNQTELPSVLAASDVYCQPNIAPEPFGIVVIEALQAGLPVVSSAFGGPAEIVDSSCGVLVTPNDPAALAEVLARLIGADDGRRQLAANGPARARAISDPAARLHELAACLRPLAARGNAAANRSAGLEIDADFIAHRTLAADADVRGDANGARNRKKAIRVLHINSGHLYGGIEVSLVTLARLRGLCPEMTPEFAVCFPGRPQDELAATGVPVHLMGATRLSRPWTVWRSRRRLRDLLEKGDFDVVVCHGCWSLDVFAPAVRRAGVPLVLWMRDAPPAPSLHWIDRLARWNPPDWTIANSDHTLRWLPRLFPGNKNTRLYNAVELVDHKPNTEARNAIRAEYGADEQSVVLLQVGRWDPYKGHLLFMEALGRLAKLPNWVCWQVGGVTNSREERYFRAVKNAARRHGIEERVRFLGFLLNRTELPRVLAAADVYCQPNITPEPFGNVVIEALQAGLPVVASAFGGPAEILDSSCGLLTPPNDPAALAQALTQLIGAPEIRRQLSVNGRARARVISDPAARLHELADILRGVAA